MTVLPIRTALLSVSDKTGLVELARLLVERAVRLVSTGGTRAALAAAGLPVTDIAEVTGLPEMLDGRVKTLHPQIHGGILARRDQPEHMAALERHGIRPIDLVVVNLYPFRQTLVSGAGFDACLENIDIGGPALIRAAAKNHDAVAVVTDPVDYPVLAEALGREGGTDLPLRRRLAAAAFAHTASYDHAVAQWMEGVAAPAAPQFPQVFSLSGTLAQHLRYGENPHQEAAFYRDGTARPGVATAVQLQGKELSFNNLNDTDAAYELVAEFERPAVAIIKHANPCGVAEADDLPSAWARALACDPVSAFGGIVALNRPLDAATAAALAPLFLEVVIAPEVSAEARPILAGRKNLRVLEAGALPDPAAGGLALRSLAGGLLVQSRDAGRVLAEDLTVATRRAPTEAELVDLLFAFRVAKHVKSNAIVYARGRATVGIGAGQMSRIDSSRIAALKAADAAAAAGEAGRRTEGSVVASDAFFPFADGLIAAAEAGVTAVIQPGGSVRDAEVIAAADERGLAMVFTGLRHFRH